MLFFSVKQLQIGGDFKFAGDDWPRGLDTFLRGLETEDPAITKWPKLLFVGQDSTLAHIKLEEDLGGFFGMAIGGEEREPRSPTRPFLSGGYDRGGVLTALRTLLGGHYSDAVLDFTEESRLVISKQSNSLLIGHDGLPNSFPNYGARLSSLAKSRLAVGRA